MKTNKQFIALTSLSLLAMAAQSVWALKIDIPKELEAEVEAQKAAEKEALSAEIESIYEGKVVLRDGEKMNFVSESGESIVAEDAPVEPEVSEPEYVEFGAMGVAEEAELAADEGRIKGQVFDKDTGEGLRGVAIVLEGTDLVTVTGTDGRYRLDMVPSGIYDLTFIKTDYIEATITEASVVGGEITNLDFAMPPRPAEMSDEAYELTGFTVSAEEVVSQNVALLALRQSSAASIDALSAQDMSKFAASDAAEALTKVTGATVSDGKYAVIRGLNDRFNTTLINGVRLPSPDPDRNAVPLDLFPSGMIDSLVVRKTFTADQPGDSTGGSLDLVTKSFPEEFTLKFGVSVGWQDGLYGNDMLKDPERSSHDFYVRGTDTRGFGSDGSQSYEPSNVIALAKDVNNDGNGEIVGYISADDPRVQYASVSRDSVPTSAPQFEPERSKSKGDLDTSFQVGDSLEVFGGESVFGYLFGFQQKHKERATSITKTEAEFDGNALDSDRIVHEEVGRVKDQYSTLLALGLDNLEGQKLFYNFIYLKVGESDAKFAEVDDPVTSYNSEISYKERFMRSHQFGGEHLVLEDVFDERAPTFNWALLLTDMGQVEPDTRAVKGYGVSTGGSGNGRPSNTDPIDSQEGIPPIRFDRTTRQDSDAYVADLEIPFAEKFKLTVGGSYEKYQRDFTQLEWTRTSAPYEAGLDGVAFPTLDYVVTRTTPSTSPNVVSIDNGDGTYDWYRSRVDVPFAINEDADSSFGYSTPFGFEAFGESKTEAAFVSTDWDIFDWLRVNGGMRFESNQLSYQDDGNAGIQSAQWLFVINEKPIDEDSQLPFVSFIVEPHEDWTVRLSWSETIAKPSFREIAPFPSLNVSDDILEIGNPGEIVTLGVPGTLLGEYSGLSLAEVENYDARLEWSQGNLLLAGTYFYKKISDPIESVSISPPTNIGRSDIVTYINNENEADLQGVELEAQLSFADISSLPSFLQYFTVGANYTYIDASVDRSQLELDSFGVGALAAIVSEDRPLFDQPEYLANAFVSVDVPAVSGKLTVSGSWVGETLNLVGTADTHPDVYFDEFLTVNVVWQQQLNDVWSLKLSAKNINSPERESFYDKDFNSALNGLNPTFGLDSTTKQKYEIKPTYSISLTAQF